MCHFNFFPSLSAAPITADETFWVLCQKMEDLQPLKLEEDKYFGSLKLDVTTRQLENQKIQTQAQFWLGLILYSYWQADNLWGVCLETPKFTWLQRSSHC